jgi:hypothetical protein
MTVQDGVDFGVDMLFRGNRLVVPPPFLSRPARHLILVPELSRVAHVPQDGKLRLFKPAEHRLERRVIQRPTDGLPDVRLAADHFQAIQPDGSQRLHLL